MVKSKKKARGISVYANLASKHRTKKDAKARKKAEYLATLPKHPVKRLLYRLHPKRMAKFWFSKQGLFTLLKAAGVAIIVMVLLGLALVAYYRKDLAQINPNTLSQRVKSTVTKYYDRNDKLLWEDKGSGDYTLVVDPKKISPCMGQATIAIEDKEFYDHGGVSISGTLRALISNSQGNATQGGSTLTQQLIKQVFFRDEAAQRGLAGIPRKIKEMILAIEVERMYTKDQILGMYLNESPYGGRRNGVESAAQTYFAKSSSELTVPECALLAAIPNNPTIYNPYNIDGHDALIARQHKVLDNMVDLKYITKEQATEAKAVPILDKLQPLASQLEGIKAPHFVLMVRTQLEKELGKTVVGEGGLTVKTTLDIDVQNQLESNMTDIFSGKLTNGMCGWGNCSTYAGFTNGAAAIEDTKSGQLIALVGSRDFNYPGFGQDNAATGFIQPGSSIKPLVYAQLFQNQGEGKTNYGSGSVLSDTATTFPGNYKPQDADGKFKGNITLRQSLALSRNIPAIKAMAVNDANSEGSTWKTIRDMGDKNYCTQGADAQAGLSSAIGGCGTKLVDHVNAIASLGRMGVYSPQTTILKVTNGTGQTLKEYKASTKQVIDPQAAYVVTDILGDGSARAGLGGSDYTPKMNQLGAKVAAKTGTSNGQIGSKIVPKDIWTVGYTPSLSMAVWLGNPDTTPLKQGNSLIPALFFDTTMAQVTKLYVDQGKAKYSDWYDAPTGIQRVGKEVYPSYWNKNSGITNAKMVFDKVSKKKATDCTPAAAKIEIGVTKTTDPITKKETISAPDGYDANADDDQHICGDAQPSVTMVQTSGGVKVTYTHGRFQLQTVQVTQNGTVLASKSVSSDDTWTIPSSQLASATTGQLTATVTDLGYYEASSTLSYTAN